MGGLFLMFNVIFAMCMTSLYQAVYTDAGKVPQSFIDKVNELQRAQTAESQGESQTNFGWEICKKCNLPRPPRAHHCRQCRACVRKMDHHCPVVNNCVGWGNYKFFILLLTWGAVMCWFGALTGGMKYLLVSFDGFSIKEIAIIAGLMLAIVYGCVLVPFASFHYMMIFNNFTTLDDMNAGVKNIYNVGYRENFEQVFGKQKLLWFVPVFTSEGDGCHFPTV